MRPSVRVVKSVQEGLILKETNQKKKDARKAKRDAAREAKKTKPSSPVRVTDSSKEPPKEEPPKEEPKKVKVVNPANDNRKGKGGKTEKGFASLAPYMGDLVSQYKAEEIDATTFYEDIVFANNMLLGRALGQEKDEMLQEREDGFPAMLHEPFLNGPVMMHLKRLSNEFPELKDVQKADEEMNGSLADAMGGSKGIRADISSFIADPLNEGRSHQQKDINGIYQLLSKYDHPLGVTLSADIPKSDRIQSNYRPSAGRKIRVAGKMQDPSFEEEMNQLRDEQKENLNFKDDKRFTAERDKGGASKFYDKLFQEGSVSPQREGQSSFSLNKPSSSTTRQILNQVRDISREESIDEKTAFKKLMSNFNGFMISLTGNKAFGTSGRAGKYGKGIEERKAPDAITPSMADAAEQLGLSSIAPNIPDSLISPYLKDPKSAFSNKTRDALADELSSVGQVGFHPSLTSAMGEGGLLSSLYGDPNAVTTEGGGLDGSQEEIAGRASEARRAAIGGVATESSMLEPEDELESIRGNRSMTPSQKMVQLERQLQEGAIDEYEYEMQRMAMGVNEHKLNPDAELNGLTGNDFDVGHALHGMNENSIIEATSAFTNNLIGMSRVMRELRYKAYANADAKTDEEKEVINKKLMAVGLTAENMIAFGNLDNATLEDKKRYNKLDEMLSPTQYVNTAKAGVDADGNEFEPKMKSVPGVGTLGQMLPTITSRLNRQHDMMKQIGLSDVDLLGAAMRYANADMSRVGYLDAFKSLSTQTRKDGSLNTYPIDRLLQYLKKTGMREAVDEEHHQKSQEQQEKYHRNHIARQQQKEEGSKDEDPEVSHRDILHDPETCVSCNTDRFGNREADTARINSPVKGKKSPYTHKAITIPLLKEYKQGGEEHPLYANGVSENDISLGSILRHIFPNNDFYDYKKLVKREANAPNKQKWRNDEESRMRRRIKEAVITGNPRAANIFKKFGLYRTKDNAIASGPAGMSNKELVASSFFMNNDDSVDKHQESMRKKTLVATRFNAITDAMHFMEELADGVYGGKKIKPGALKTSEQRRNLLNAMITAPTKGVEKQSGIVAKRKREIDSYKDLYSAYLEQKAIQDSNEEKTKPKKVKDADGVEREERGEYQSPGQIAIIKEQGEALQNKYGTMLALRNKKLKEIKSAEKKITKLKDASDDNISRTNEYMLGAFIGKDVYTGGEKYNASDKLAKIFAKMQKSPESASMSALLGMLGELHDDMYGDSDYDSVFKADTDGRVDQDYTHSLDKYKLGRMGEMAGTGVMSITNNKAIPRINSVNQLLAHRIQMGFPLTEEDIKRAKDMLHDADMADALDPQTIQSIGKELTADDFNMMNISELPHEHHDDTENELGLLTEDEAARREQNSHFTKGSEKAIANGDIEAHNLVSNWRDNAPTLCGVCHGHRFVTRDEAVSYIRHRIPSMRDETRNSPKINKYIEKKMRPRGHASYDEHPMNDEMDAGEHEQLACPGCEHSADYVQGGKISNGLCGDCFGTGERDPANDEHIQDGYTDADGNKIDGKNHHYSHNDMVNQKFDYLNQLALGQAEMIQSGEIPDYLKGVLSPKSPVWQMFSQHVGSGKFKTFEEMREARKKKQREPLVIDPKAPEIPYAPHERDKPQNTMPDIAINTPAEIGAMPEIEMNTMPEIKLNSVNQLAMEKHHQIMMKKHCESMHTMAVHGQPQMKEEIDALYNSIINDPALLDAHNNEDHHLVEKMHKLQEIAEANYVDDYSDFHATKHHAALGTKEQNAIRAKRRQLPTDEEGNLKLTMADVFGGNAPMSFGDFEPLTPYHGHMLASKEIREGLFEPGQDNKPKEVTHKEMKNFFAGNKQVSRLLKRIEDAEQFKPEKLEKIKTALSKIEKPMVARKTSNMFSDELNSILKEFGEKPMIAGMEKRAMTYSEEAIKAFKAAGATDVNSLLTAENKIGQHRALNEGYTTMRNQAIKPLWQQYVMRKALQHFMARVNNPLDHPKIPAGIDQSNFSLMVGEDSGLFQLLKDEAAKVAGYEDEEQLEKKVNLATSVTIGGVKLNPRDFKASVMEGVDHDDSEQMEMGYIKHGMTKPDKNGVQQPTETFVTKPADEILQESRDRAVTPQDRKNYEAVKRMTEYHEMPNWKMREDIRGVIDGEDGKHDGFDGHEEVSQAYANRALPEELQSHISTGQASLKLSHPALNPQKFGDAEAYALAAERNLQHTNKQQPAVEPPPVAYTPPTFDVTYGRTPTANQPIDESIYASNEDEYPN
tara:strand:- start:30325 stop:37071 length:6747 start_codon:yes stop_codon:yes gene_type:complete